MPVHNSTAEPYSEASRNQQTRKYICISATLHGHSEPDQDRENFALSSKGCIFWGIICHSSKVNSFSLFLTILSQSPLIHLLCCLSTPPSAMLPLTLPPAKERPITLARSVKLQRAFEIRPKAASSPRLTHSCWKNSSLLEAKWIWVVLIQSMQNPEPKLENAHVTIKCINVRGYICHPVLNLQVSSHL